MRARAAIIVVALGAGIFAALPAEAAKKWIYCTPSTRTQWHVGAGGDACRTSYNPTETRPPFIGGGHLGSNDVDGPWLEWSTKLVDLPSGVFLQAGLVADGDLLFVGGAATNSFVALNRTTGLPVWRFSPDQRADAYTAAYPASNAPVIANGIVYVTFANGFLYALDAKTGRKIWSYRSTDASINPNPPPGVANDPLRKTGTGPFDPVRQPVPYTKPHGVTSYCDGRVLFMTLGGWGYSIDARTGGDVRKAYVDSPDFPGELRWWEYKIGGALRPENRSAGSSTRRFEAVPGLGCLHGEVQVAGSDGVVRFYNPKTMQKTNEYRREDTDPVTDAPIDFCVNAGFNCDITVGNAHPVQGDYFIATLDARLMRLDWRTKEPKWRRTYVAPFPFQVGDTLPIAQEHREHGFIAQAVIGGAKALDVERDVMFFGNQDGHLYVLDVSGATEASCGCGLRPSDPQAPPLLARVGISPNREPQTPYTRRGEGGPWDHNEHALNGLVLGGDVLYLSTWDRKMHAYDVRDPSNPKKVWEHEITTDQDFPYPPFGETFGDDYQTPYSDIDNQIWSAPALLDGHLYFSANDGTVYSFNLKKRVKPVRNLAILGSGTVPFIPEWDDRVGAFDRVWTPAELYRNQQVPSGYRLTASTAGLSAGAFIVASAAAWWWYRRRDDEWDAPEVDA